MKTIEVLREEIRVSAAKMKGKRDRLLARGRLKKASVHTEAEIIRAMEMYEDELAGMEVYE